MEKTGSNDVNENAVISEEALESVDGGSGGPISVSELCFFEPTTPLRTETRGGTLWAECAKRCSFSVPLVTLRTFCSCHGTSRCIDRMHKLDNTWHRTYFAHPHDRFNHNEPGKAVRT